MSTAIVISLFLKSEKFYLFVSCRDTQHSALVTLEPNRKQGINILEKTNAALHILCRKNSL